MKTVLLLVALIACCGCGKYEYGPELTEKARVSETVYTPPTHGSGMGVSSGGSLVVTSVSTSPVYAVVFECEHGKFIVNREELWHRMKVGMEVNVRYREQFWVTKDDRVLYDYDFLDAEPIK